MNIKQATNQGLCRHCNSGKNGNYQDQQMPSLNYRNVPPGMCALTDEERKTMIKEHNLRRVR